MSSDRDLAQQWLAEQIAEAEAEVWGESADRDFTDIADAILDTPGVEVGQLLTPMTGERRLVIKLPPAAQHQDRIEGEKP